MERCPPSELTLLPSLAFWERYIPSLGDAFAGEIPLGESRSDRRRSGHKQPPQPRIYTAREPDVVSFVNAATSAYGEKVLDSIWRK